MKDRQDFGRQKSRWEQGMLQESTGTVRKQELVSFGWSARYILKSSRSQSEGVFGPRREDAVPPAALGQSGKQEGQGERLWRPSLSPHPYFSSGSGNQFLCVKWLEGLS